MLDQWIKCTAGDHRFVRLNVDRSSEETEEDTENWIRIYDEYIERFGLSKHYAKVLEAMKELALLNVKYAKLMAQGNPDRFLETLIDMAEQKLKDLMQESGVGMSIEDTLPILSKAQGYPIRAHETRFVEYLLILESHARSGKAS